MTIIDLKNLPAHVDKSRRLMGIDHSKTRLGLAVSNPELTLATPLAVLTRGKLQEDIARLRALADEYAVGGFVVGLPLNMDDTEGPRAQSVRHFADNLVKEFSLPLAFFDERLSTAHVKDILDAQNVPHHKRAGLVDKLAAQVILQDALDFLARRGA